MAQIEQRDITYGRLYVLSGDADGLVSLGNFTLGTPGELYAFTVTLRRVSKQNLVIDPIDALNIRLQFSSTSSAPVGLSGNWTNSYAVPDDALSFVVRGGVVANASAGSITQELRIGPGANTPRDDFWFEVAEVTLWNAASVGDFDTIFAEGVTVIETAERIEIDSALTDLQNDLTGAISQLTAIQGQWDELFFMTTGTGGTRKWTAAASNLMAQQVDTVLTAQHGNGSWQPASLATVLANQTLLSTAVSQIPTDPLLATDSRIDAIPTNPLRDDDVRLDFLDAAVSAPVVVGGYVAGQSPADVIDLTATNAAIAAIPTNPVLTTDARLDAIGTIGSPVTVGGYSSGQSPSEQIDLTATNAAVAAIPTNPVLTSDSRLDNIGNGSVTVAGYAAGQSPAEQISLTATDAAIAAVQTAVDAIPTNPVLTDDVRLDYLDGPVSMPVVVGGYLTGQSPSDLIDVSGIDVSAVTVAGYATGQSPGEQVDLTATNAAIAAIPTNPVLTSDSRLDNIGSGGGSVTVAGYASGQSPAEQIDLAATNTAIAAVQTAVDTIPTNPVLTDDSRLDYLDSPVSMPVIVGGYLTGQSPSDLIDVSGIDVSAVTVAGYASGQSPGEQVDLTATNAAIAAIPTNPVLTNDARLDNIGSNSVTVSGYAAGQSPAEQISLAATTAAIATVQTAVDAIPTNPVLTDDVRLDYLDGPVSMPVVVGGYLAGQAPNDLIDVSGIDVSAVTVAGYASGQSPAEQIDLASISSAIGQIPTNPVLATDSRLDEIGTFNGNVNVVSYASGMSPAEQISLTATNAAIAAIPTNPVLTDDSRLDYLDGPVSMPVIVGGHIAGQSPSEQVDLTATNAAIAAIPTNPLQTDDARLNNLNAPIGDTMLAASYVAPDNAGITAAKNAAETVRDARTLAAADYATLANQNTLIGMVGTVQSGVSSRITIITSTQYSIPDAGTTPYTIVIQSNDASGQAVNLDSDALPVVTAFASSVDRSAKLSVVTKLSTGRYELTYTVDAADNSPESITLTVTGTQSTTQYTGQAVVTVSDTAATDYTTTDRTRDQAIQTAVDAINAALPSLSTFDHNANNVTVGGYAAGQSPADFTSPVDLTATNAAIAAVQTAVDAVPVNPLLTNDSRIDNLSTFNPANDSVKLDLTQQLGNGSTLDAALTAVSSTGSGPNRLTITAIDGDSVPVAGVMVDLLDSNDNRLGLFATTDAFGVVVFDLQAATYKATIRSTAGLLLSAPVVMAVGADVSYNLPLVRTETTIQASPDLCIVATYVLDSALNPVPGAVVTANVSNDATLVDDAIATRILTQTVADANGYFQLRLPRQDQFTAGGRYTINVKAANGADIFRTVTGFIPNQATCNLKDIEANQ